MSRGVAKFMSFGARDISACQIRMLVACLFLFLQSDSYITHLSSRVMQTTKGPYVGSGVMSEEDSRSES